MQLTVPEAAHLLHVPEETVYRWIRDQGLPASQFGGRYFLNRVWLLEWAHEKGIPIAVGTDERMPLLSQGLERGGLHVDVPGRTPAEVLLAGVERLPLPPDLPREELGEMLLARERQGSTGFGDGIAIPHSRGPILLHVPQPIVAVCYLREPVDFAAHDGKPVTTLFLQVTPTVRTHLHLLSWIARALSDAEFAGLVRERAELPRLLERARKLEAAPSGPSSSSAGA
jgi:PTS system nitrogen regulatory IIA component